ncbi:nicotinate phosphoribosyltransferase [Vallitalea okinawensis]|uniref:nicotinate phosphoribosyltransferase n=1 Tax=Vallitalea okinawensis TaxID=2078660 RepID=UPI000CFBD7C6|nr:nicotinate phosphoribosyltransferase [Vallitalea okinawensis]
MLPNDLTLLTDLYQLTMMQGYYKAEKANREVVFDLFYRTNPSEGSYAIMAGLEQVIEYIENLRFSDEQLDYLRSLNIFDEDFIYYLKEFRFTGDIYAIEEGSVIFPKEPLIRVKAPLLEAQFIETTLLNIINHQSLIATKSSRVCWAAKGDGVLEFGLRRAQGPDAGLYGARAAVIGGCTGTSNVLAGQKFSVPVSGTHAHSWVMSFDDELTAFRTYAETFPNACILLVDTYNTLKSGVPNAIKVFDELKAKGIKPKKYGIRLDSGDLAYLSKEAKKMLDAAGYHDAIISASSDLDEYLISTLKQQGTTINLWGVGTRLITSSDCPAFGGVYKLAAKEDENGQVIPKIKLSDNPEKVTNPGLKKIYRIYDEATGKIKADLITLAHEEIDASKPLTLFDPNNTWKRMTLKPGAYGARELLKPIFKDGQNIYQSPTVMEIRAFCQKELETLWPESRRLVNPHVVPVDLSQELFDLKKDMIENIKRNSL